MHTHMQNGQGLRIRVNIHNRLAIDRCAQVVQTNERRARHGCVLHMQIRSWQALCIYADTALSSAI